MVDECDLRGVCCNLGVDAFVVWQDMDVDHAGRAGDGDPAEDRMGEEGPCCWGWALIATPFVVRGICISLAKPQGPIPEHGADVCGTLYPPAGVPAEDLLNPITGGWRLIMQTQAR